VCLLLLGVPVVPGAAAGCCFRLFVLCLLWLLQLGVALLSLGCVCLVCRFLFLSLFSFWFCWLFGGLVFFGLPSRLVAWSRRCGLVVPFCRFGSFSLPLLPCPCPRPVCEVGVAWFPFLLVGASGVRLQCGGLRLPSGLFPGLLLGLLPSLCPCNVPLRKKKKNDEIAPSSSRALLLPLHSRPRSRGGYQSSSRGLHLQIIDAKR